MLGCQGPLGLTASWGMVEMVQDIEVMVPQHRVLTPGQFILQLVGTGNRKWLYSLRLSEVSFIYLKENLEMGRPIKWSF